MNTSQNETTGGSSLEDQIFNLLMKIELTIKSLSLIEHLTYTLAVIFVPDMRKRGYLYLNHASITNVLYIVILFAYSFGDMPSYADEQLNNFLCSISEIYWPFSNYIRVYSILLIAIYRFLAAYRIREFKRLNSSKLYLACPIGVVWLVSIVCPVVLKYMFSTRTSISFCLDGYSDNYTLTVLYFVVNFIIMVVLPSAMVIYLYALIISKLNEMSRKLLGLSGMMGQETMTSFTTPVDFNTISLDNNTIKQQPSVTITKTLRKNRKERRFAQQFVLMCFSMIFSSCMLVLITIRNVVPMYYLTFRLWRPVFRSLNAISVSLIPVISVYFNPSKRKLVKCINRFNTNSSQDNSPC